MAELIQKPRSGRDPFILIIVEMTLDSVHPIRHFDFYRKEELDATRRENLTGPVEELDCRAARPLLPRLLHPFRELPVMDLNAAVVALGALAQEHRLALFRQLVQAGPDGMSAGAIAERLGIPNSSLSFHLAQLRGAGLITQDRQHRSLIYRANYPAMNGLVDYLTENCCGGAECAPAASPQTIRKSA